VLVRVIGIICALGWAATSAHAFSVVTDSYMNDYETIVGQSHWSEAITDENFDTVEWYVHGNLEWTDTSTGTNSSIFDFHYTGYGADPAISRYVKAVAYNGSASAEDGYSLMVAVAMTVGAQEYGSDAVVGYSHVSVATTGVAFDYVDWFVDGNPEATDEAVGVDTTSHFDFTYETYGATTGVDRYVKARAYYPDGSWEETGYLLTVWSQSVEVLYVFPSEDYDAVSGHDFTMEATTDRPFDWVDWFVHGVPAGRTYGSSSSDTHTTFTFDYAGLGSVNGAAKYVKAQAWKDGTYDEAGEPVTVWADLASVVVWDFVEDDVFEFGGSSAYTINLTVPNDNYALSEAAFTTSDGGIAAVVYEDPVTRHGVTGYRSARVTLSGTDPGVSGADPRQYITGALKWLAGFLASLAANEMDSNLEKVRARVGTLAGSVWCATDLVKLPSTNVNDFVQMRYDAIEDNLFKITQTSGPGAFGWYLSVPTGSGINVFNWPNSHHNHMHKMTPGAGAVQARVEYAYGQQARPDPSHLMLVSPQPKDDLQAQMPGWTNIHYGLNPDGSE
jgi:hypothetical protein